MDVKKEITAKKVAMNTVSGKIVFISQNVNCLLITSGGRYHGNEQYQSTECSQPAVGYEYSCPGLVNEPQCNYNDSSLSGDGRNAG